MLAPMDAQRPGARRAGRMRVTPEAEAEARTRGRRDRGREAPAAPPGSGLPRHRPVARPADPRRVRRGLRRDGQGRAGSDGLRLRTDQARRPALRARADDRAEARRVGLRGDHRRRPGHHGGREPRLPGGRRPVGRLQHRAAARAVHQPVRRPRGRVPLLLRAQDDVREVRGRLRHPARRFRDARRAVRGASPSSRPARSATSRWCWSARPTGRGCSTGSAARS